MRILVLTHEYPPIGGGGGKVAEDICEGLVRTGNQVRVVTTSLKGLPLFEQRGAVELVRLRSGRKFAYKATFASMALYLFFGFFRVLKDIRSWKPDVIHVHFAVPAGALGYVCSKITKVPYVLTVHLGDVPGGVPEKTDTWFRWVKPLTPPIWRNAARITAVSEFTRGLAQKQYPFPIQVIPNGVDINKLNPGQISLKHPPQIVFAGRLVPQKNPILLVHTLGEVKDLDWTCVIVGDGPLRPQMEQEISRLGLQDRIQLTGWVTPTEVTDWFRESDILFMPSLSEGLPVVGVQALALGLAILASSSGGFVDLVQQGKNGFLFDPSDRQNFSIALREMLSDPQALLALRNSSRSMSARFDLDLIIRQYQTVLNQVVETYPRKNL